MPSSSTIRRDGKSKILSLVWVLQVQTLESGFKFTHATYTFAKGTQLTWNFQLGFSNKSFTRFAH